MGESVHETPFKNILIRNYPIVWDGKNLEDFRVTQCLFLGNKITLPNHLGILAAGRALEVDHCVLRCQRCRSHVEYTSRQIQNAPQSLFKHLWSNGLVLVNC